MDLQRPHHDTATLVQGPSTPSRQLRGEGLLTLHLNVRRMHIGFH
jgi:hypothetical protein